MVYYGVIYKTDLVIFYIQQVSKQIEAGYVSVYEWVSLSPA